MNRPRIAALILAAGGSQRFGSDKREFCLMPTYRSIKDAIYTDIDTIAIMLRAGESASSLNFCPESEPKLHIFNAGYESNRMGDNLRDGFLQLHPSHDSVIICLADMPLINKNTYKTIIYNTKAAPDMIHRPVFEGRAGHPVVFPTSLKKAFSELEGDEGAKSIIRAYPKKVNLIEVNDPGVVFDIDTPQDLEVYHETISM